MVILKALEALERSQVAEKIGWTVLLNPDEEIGSPGSRPILEAEAKQHNVGFVFEPSVTDTGTLAGARKGSGNFSVVVSGKASHAGRDFAAGRNAICALSELIGHLSQLNGKRDGVTLNMGRIEGGGPLNMVPNLAIGHFNVRTKLLDDESWLKAEIGKALDLISQQDGISCNLHGSFTRPPRPLEGRVKKLFEFVKTVGDELGLGLHWQATGGVCDGNNLTAAGLPTVDTLGVRGGKIHSDQEYILLDSMVERAKLTALLLLKLTDPKLQKELQ